MDGFLNCMSAIPQSVSRKLERALATKADSGFLERLSVLDPRYAAVWFEQRPEPIAMFGGLWALHMAVTTEGMWKFLAEDDGNGFSTVRDWCASLGADRTVEYLTEVEKLFPGSTVPVDAGKRGEQLDRLEEQARKSGDADPLRVLDERYADAMPELAGRLRDWVAAKRAEVARIVATLPPPVRTGDFNEPAQLTEALREANRQLAGMEAEHDATVASLKQLARTAGLLPPKVGKKDEKRLARFMDAASALSESKWITVAMRYNANSAEIQGTVMRAFALSQQLRSGQLGDPAGFEKGYRKLMEATRPLFAITDRLPQQVQAGGRKLGLLEAAHSAVAAATAVIRLHDWFLLYPADRERARAAYAPFEGLAWTPEIPPRD